jgi:hypothetical protein
LAFGDAVRAMPHTPVLATARLVVLGLLVVVALVPNRFLPGGQGIDVEGALAGDPVSMQWTGEVTTPYQVAVRMETGRCDVVLLDAGGTVMKQWSAEQATDRGRIQPGSSVKLLPRPVAEGYYHLRMGPVATWGPMLMATRVVLLGLSATLALAWLFGVRVDRRQWDMRRLLVVGGTAAFFGIVVYSLIHEAGHLLFGLLWGGKPAWDQVSWTVFSGEEPHAAFRSLPGDAVPWMSAGGMLLPTLVGCALVAVGFWWGGRVAVWLQLVLVTSGSVLLLGNLGLFADTDHMLPLALHLGFHGTLAQIVALLPAVLTLGIFGYIGYRLRSVARQL